MKAIILASGKGIRMKPLTDFKQKCMLPICNTPLLHYNINLLEMTGLIDEIIVMSDRPIINTHHKVIIENPTGTANSLLHASHHINEEDNILVLNGDIVFDSNCIKDIIQVPNTILIKKEEDTSIYGKIELNKDKTIKEIKEKCVSGEGFINAGVYYLSTDILNYSAKISIRKEFELTDIINLCILSGDIFNCKETKEYWKDIGTPLDYLDVNIYLLNKKKTGISKTTKISNDVILRNNIIIGNDCNIYNCVLDNVVIGNNCTIGDYSVIKRSVIMDNTKIPHHNYVGDSVIAENCNLGAGTKIANTRLDGKNVIQNRKKLGAIIGYNVKTGINTSINAGAIIPSNSRIIIKELIK